MKKKRAPPKRQPLQLVTRNVFHDVNVVLILRHMATQLN